MKQHCILSTEGEKCNNTKRRGKRLQLKFRVLAKQREAKVQVKQKLEFSFYVLKFNFVTIRGPTEVK